MDNIERVTRHLRDKRSRVQGADPDREVLSLIPALDGTPWVRDEEGAYWRAYHFIERTSTFQTCPSPGHAYEAAKLAGGFLNMLSDLPGPRLHEIIPFFHHAPRRLDALKKAIEDDRLNRVASAKAEIEFALARNELARVVISLLEAGEIPERPAHNDTKLNNILFDEETGRGLCLVDLDTCMPGCSLYDFGDLVRTAATLADEDEPDLDRVDFKLPFYEALVRGFIEGAGGLLGRSEIEHLDAGGRLITFTVGVRFLTDYLSGDTYFKINRPGHNLDRCRTQFKLVQEMEKQESAMKAAVRLA